MLIGGNEETGIPVMLQGIIKPLAGALSMLIFSMGTVLLMPGLETESDGCNPWPILDANKTVTDEYVSISYEFLDESKEIFANWKSNY